MKIFLFILLLLSVDLYSQLETEIIGINFNNYSKSNYNGNIYNSSTQKIDAFVNYGHDISKKSNLFYHASFQNYNFDTKINYQNIPQDDFILFPNIHNYSLTTLAIGMKNELKKEWNLTNIITITFSDDIQDNNLHTNNYFRTFSFVTKKKSDKLSFGFGLYLSNTNDKLRVLPILSLKLKNKKRGVKLFFPRELKFWQKVSKASYIELKTILNSENLNYNEFHNLNIEIFSISSNLTYNYIIKNKIKIKAGIGLPYNEYEYQSNLDNFKTIQKSQINFSFGVSFVVFQD